MAAGKTNGRRSPARKTIQPAPDAVRAVEFIRVELPWPSAELSPNARGAWYERNPFRRGAIMVARTAANLAAERYGQPNWTGCRLHWHADIYEPDRAKRDLDNMVGRLKPYQDGIAAALGFDDSQIRSTSSAFMDGTHVRDGAVVVTIRVIPGPLHFE